MGNQAFDISEFREHVLPEPGENYWWRTTGREIFNMMKVAAYPQATRNAFLSYYHDVMCPLLGAAPDASDPRQAKSWTWDGSTHEYSFELTKGETHRPKVRFVLDVSCLRPVDSANPLNLVPTDMLIHTFAGRAPGFDSTWYRALRRFFDYSHLPRREQQSLVDQAGHSSPILVGFDITRHIPPASPAPEQPSMLPVVGKAYFLPCFAAAAKGTDRFTTICQAIHALPDIGAHPNVLSALACIEAFLATKPKDWAHGARYLATDFLAPDRSRLKIYLRCPSTDFDEIWDFFTLGGRISAFENDKQKYQDFIGLLGGSCSTSAAGSNDRAHDGMETASRRKLTTLYFSLDDRYPVPAPKIAFCARNFASHDAAVARGLDEWLLKYGWRDHGDDDDSRASVATQVSQVFEHRGLNEKAGIFTFIGLARRDSAKRDLSIQVYMCPELYESPR